MAPLILKQALSGLKLLFREAPHQGFHSGCIQGFDVDSDCFVVWSDDSSQLIAVQFNQFVVEQTGDGQLMLKVPACTLRAVPSKYLSPDTAQQALVALTSAGPSSHGSSSFGTPEASQQLSTVLSQQLSGLIGRCLSHTEDGFEVAAPEQEQQQQLQPASNPPGSSAAPMDCDHPQQQPPLAIARVSRHSTDSAADDGSFWGSPVKHDSSAVNAAAAALAAAAAGQYQHGSHPPSSMHVPSAKRQHIEANSTPPQAAGAAAGSTGPAANALSSFQEISRMISQGEDNSPFTRPGSIKTSLAPGHAARLLDEQGSWGTPQENSPWGTPREQQMGSNATSTPTSGSHDQPGQQHSHHHSGGSALHKAVFGGEQLHRRLEAVVTTAQQQLEPLVEDSSQAPADVLGMPKSGDKLSAAAAAAESELEPAAAVAAAVAAVDAAAATEADAFGSMDFTIPVAMDVQPRPHSRNSSRMRELYRAGSASGNTGVVVDVPQPLTARHGNLMRSPGRSLPAPSDPGHTGITSAFSNAANISAAQVSASVGGAGAFELRRTTTNLGSSHAASRRMSRNASSRLNADQDWALFGPDGQALQQPGGMQPPQPRASLGQVLHAPAVVTSRRASRTLSGRLALDQDLAAAVLLEQMDDAEPDVLSRPLGPAAPGLDTIISRRQSTSNGRGTPDSDGFGFSEFEGLEPLVPPEEAAAAALTEAAAAAAAATEAAAAPEGASGGGAGTLHHHRSHRRSARNLGAPPVVNMVQRPSMRLSDQDPGHHGLAALPQMTAAAVAAAAAARAHSGAAAGPGVGRIGSYDVVMMPAPSLQEGPEDAMELEQVEDPAGDGSAGPNITAGAAAAAPGSRLDSRADSGGAAGSPLASGTGASTRSTSGSLSDSRRSSKRSIPSIFQAAAAVAAAAEAAAAAAVGFALGGRDRTTGEQQQAGQVPSADGQAAAAQGMDEAALPVNSFLKQRLAGEGPGSGFGSVDSFTCPPFMPLTGSITVTGNRPSANGTGSHHSSSNGSIQQGIPVPGADSTAAIAEQAAAGAQGPMPAYAAAMAAAAAAAIAADGEGLYGSPAANIRSWTGSPAAAQAALLRRQQLMSSEGSEWGSGALGSHIHLSTSGIDSPTGSAVFRLGGNSPYPLDAADSAGTSVPPGELSAALESLAVQAGCASAGGNKSVGVGASRMGREAAAAAAGGVGSYTSNLGPVGAAALLVGTSVLSKGTAGLSEITPADEDEDPGGKISAKYPSDSGNNQSAGAVFFRLAGGAVDPGEPKTATAQAVEEQVAGQIGRGSSSGGGAAINRVLGKVIIGQAALLTKPTDRTSGTTSSSSQSAASGAAAAAAAAASFENEASIANSGRSSEAAPPSYAESVGADADDETTPHANPFAVGSRRVWPAHAGADAPAGPALGTAVAAAAAVAGNTGGDGSMVRQSAVLGAAHNPASAGSGAVSGVQQQQQAESSADVQWGTTGLVRRTPQASRAPSQTLPAGARPSFEGLGLLGGSSFNYGDECEGRPFAKSAAFSLAGQDPNGSLIAARMATGRVVMHAFLTLSAQWFDSMALVVLGPQLTGALLPPDMPQLQQLRELFSIFALGHVLWLLGSFLWPAVAAKLGRRGLLAWTLGLSAFCTGLVGCMPSYAEGGMVGIGIIAVLRFISGAAAGNTAPAALAYLSEHAPQCPNLHASLVPASMAAGACAAAGLALVLSWVMSPAVLAASGWRVVLVMSLLGNAVAGGLRGWVLQEPEGQMQEPELRDRANGHVGRILRYHAPELLGAVLLQAFATSGLFLLTAWLPAYFMQLSGMATSTALLIHTINMATLSGSMVLGGVLADEWAPVPVLLATCATVIPFAYPAWLLFSMGVAEVTWLAQCILCVLLGLHWGALTEVLMDMFPPGMRASALTIAHVIPMVGFGSTAPLMAIGFVSKTGSAASPAYVNIIMAAVTAVVVVWQARKSSGRGLRL